MPINSVIMPVLTSLAMALTSAFPAPTPAILFNDNEPGIWLDNADWQTGWFQDAAGTTPVTAMEQPLGLALSKDQGLRVGAELVTNGTNPTSTTGWTPSAGSTLTVVANKFRVQGQESYQTETTVIGKWYKCSVDISVINPGAVYVGTAPRNASNYSTGQVSASSTKTFYFLATATTTYISLLPWNGGTEYCDFNNISIKPIAGNHVFQSTSGVRPVVSARYNLLTKTEGTFNNASFWSKASVTVVDNTTTSPTGTATGSLIYPSTTGANRGVYRTTSITSGQYTFSVYAKAAGINWLNLTKTDTTTGAAWFNLSTGTVGTVASGVTASIKSAGNGWYQCSVTLTVTLGYTPVFGAVDADNTTTVTANGTNGVYVWGVDYRPSDQATGLIPQYQRVDTSSDYDGPDKGFPPYISFNGTQWMQTAATDYSGVNKMLVVAGVRKLSDAALGMIVELSTNMGSNPGAYYLAAPLTPADKDFALTFNTGASVRSAVAKPYAAPYSAVISGALDTKGANANLAIKMRVNAVDIVVTSDSISAGGNFGNYPHYIGARAGSSLFFTGRLYQLIVRGSTVAANDAQIGVAENYTNLRTRAYA